MIAIPVFYLVIQQIVREDIDEHLMATKEILKPRIAKALSANTIDKLNFLDQDITITASSDKNVSDSFSTRDYYDSISQEIVPNRILTSRFIMGGQPVLLRIKASLVDNDDLIASIVKVQVV